MTKTQKNVVTVLNRLAKSVKDGDLDAYIVAERLDEMCDSLLGDDFFGTEGQLDPRGDQRDAEWNIDRIQK